MSTIFYSWQSDLDARVTRHLVREALASAVDALHAELEERHELTSDTQGVAGSPDIVATILAKIDAAAVFVCDVTPVAATEAGKAVANPNVLIELGWAKKSLGLERIITVWNTAFAGTTPEQLPFDMRGRRSPMAFHLAPGASKPELREVRERLAAQLLPALRACIAVASPPEEPLPAPQPAWQPHDASTPALWFPANSELTVNEDGSPGRKRIQEGPYTFVRILPRGWATPADFGNGRAGHASILGPTSGYSWGAVRGGFLTYSGSIRSGADRPLANFTMQFRATGEIWGVSPFASDGKADGRFWADAVISHANDFIDANVAFLLRQGARGPFEVRIGVSDLTGLHWTSDTRWGGRPVALEDAAEGAFTLESVGEAERLDGIETAWGDIAAAFGLPRPPREILVRQIRGF